MLLPATGARCSARHRDQSSDPTQSHPPLPLPPRSGSSSSRSEECALTPSGPACTVRRVTMSAGQHAIRIHGDIATRHHSMPPLHHCQHGIMSGPATGGKAGVCSARQRRPRLVSGLRRSVWLAGSDARLADGLAADASPGEQAQHSLADRDGDDEQLGVGVEAHELCDLSQVPSPQLAPCSSTHPVRQYSTPAIDRLISTCQHWLPTPEFRWVAAAIPGGDLRKQ